MLGCNGNSEVRTPNLDLLARRGVNFPNAYCVSPVCVPSRASLMTGMFASDVGSYCNSTPFNGVGVETWIERARGAGYNCQGTGKLDLTVGRDYGFDKGDLSHGHSVHPDITSLFRRPLCYRVDERKIANGSFVDEPHSKGGGPP